VAAHLQAGDSGTPLSRRMATPPPRAASDESVFVGIGDDGGWVERMRQRQGNPRGARVPALPSLLYGVDLAPAITEGPGLSPDDIQFFKEEGYLVKRQLLDPASLMPVTNHVWKHAPACVRRADPTSWVDPNFLPGLHNLHGTTTSKDGRSGSWSERAGPPREVGRGHFGDGSWRLMSPAATASSSSGGDCVCAAGGGGGGGGGLGSEGWLLSATAHAPAVVGVVERLLGARVRAAPRVRGVYMLWPTSDHRERAVHGHNDSRPGQVSAMVLAADVPPHSGGFTVWPSSHR
jgi:hypothetical protein